MSRINDDCLLISNSDIAKAIEDETYIEDLVLKSIQPLYEKRDTYYGVVKAVTTLIETNNEKIIQCLQEHCLLAIDNKKGNICSKAILTKILPRIIKKHPGFVAPILRQVIDSNKNSNKYEQFVKFKLQALKLLRQIDEILKNKFQVDQQIVNEIIEQALQSKYDSLKVEALSLMLDTRSTTKKLDKELNVFKTLFPCMQELNDAALRQLSISLTAKLIRRLKDGLLLVMRDKKIYTSEFKKELLESYNNFVTWFFETCNKVLKNKPSFGSLTFTLSVLKNSVEHIGQGDEYLKLPQWLGEKLFYDLVFDFLHDPFDENKDIAIELLFILPKNQDFYSYNSIEQIKLYAYSLTKSVRRPDCATSQYMFKLLVKLESIVNNHDISLSILEHLNILINTTQDILNREENNCLKALVKDPIYPKLACVRSLLEDKNINLPDHKDRWVTLIRKTMPLLIEACSTVSNVVCNMNPETIGHLPMDLGPLDIESLSKCMEVSLNLSDDEVESITSQVLLVSGWRTIKECSLAMGNMCAKFWWPETKISSKVHKFTYYDFESILREDDIRNIINFFDHYLRNLRHRGAFEQAYKGFSMITKRIWFEKKYKDMLLSTLRSIFQELSKNEFHYEKEVALKAYITRRSAGLPFIVQAIAVAEHRKEDTNFEWIMNTIFSILNASISESFRRVHCLNILKALTSDHFLGEKVMPYAGSLIEIVLDGFKSKDYPTRNCSSMLLKAVLDRVFGCNRLKTRIHRKNQLSFEKFFTLCPTLHTRMIKELNADFNDLKNFGTIHCVFILLFRLKHTFNPSEGNSYEEVIKPFIQPVLNIVFESKDCKLKSTASRLIVHLEAMDINPPQTQDHSTKSISEVREKLKPFQHDWVFFQGAIFLTNAWIEYIGNITNYSKANKLRIDRIFKDINYIIEIVYLIFQDYCLQKCQKESNFALAANTLEMFESYYYHFGENMHDISLPSNLLEWNDNYQPGLEQTMLHYIYIRWILDISSAGNLSIELRDLIGFFLKRCPDKRFSKNFQSALVRIVLVERFHRDDFPDDDSKAFFFDLSAEFKTIFNRIMEHSENDDFKEVFIPSSFKYFRQTSTSDKIYLSEILDSYFNKFDGSLSYLSLCNKDAN